MDKSSNKFRVGVDIGGTFTDLVLLGTGGHALTVKVPSTPDDYSRSIAESLEVALPRIGIAGDEVEEVIHGTTVATNAILEKRGVQTGLVTTAGFRDILEIRRLRMPRLYDLTWQKPEALAARVDRVEVAERIDHTGRILEPLDEASVHAALDRLLANGVQSIAVALINSYANDGHERRIAEMIRERGIDVPLCLSSEVNPELKEYERTSTTVVNAYILPVVGTYLRSLERVLRRLEIAGPLRIMQSNGGAMGVDAAAARPVNIIESGPSAGVVGAAEIAAKLGYQNVLTFDMGRDDGQGGDDRGRPVRPGRGSRCRGGDQLRGAVPEGRRLPRERSGHRHRRGRSGGRLSRSHRRGGRARRRAGERGRQAGAGVLRPGRHGGDGDRRQRRARLHQPYPACRGASSRSAPSCRWTRSTSRWPNPWAYRSTKRPSASIAWPMRRWRGRCARSRASAVATRGSSP